MKLNLKPKKRINTVYNLPVEKLTPHKLTPRSSFDNYELTRLSESIRINGVLQPLITVKADDGYEIISGVRRYKAAEMLGLATLPCLIVEESKNPWLIPMIESLTHTPHSLFEVAEVTSSILDTRLLTLTEVAEGLGFTQQGLCDMLKTLNFSEEERNKILRGGLELRHLKPLHKIHNELQREKILDIILTRGMTPKETERYVENILNPQPTEKTQENPQSTALFFDKRILENTLQKVVSTAQKSGIPVKYNIAEAKDVYEYTITVPKETSK